MALIKKVTYDHSITEGGHIQVRQITRIMEDGIQIGSDQYHRHVLSPGDDATSQDERTKILAKVIHTPDCITAYRDSVVTVIDKT